MKNKGIEKIVKLVTCEECRFCRHHEESVEWQCERHYPYRKVEQNGFCDEGEDNEEWM